MVLLKKIKKLLYIPFDSLRTLLRFDLFPSEFGEDKVLKNLLKFKNGFYLDIGCHHPVRESNTYYLYKKLNWRGINVDISKTTINMFNIFRPHDLNINAALGDKTKIVAGYFFNDLSCFNTLDFSRANEIYRNLGYKFYKSSINCFTPEDFIKNNKIKKIDFLNIDIEGLDETILNIFPYDKVRPKVIAFENHNNTIEENIKMMNIHNYFLASKCGPTYIFVDQKLIQIKKWPFNLN